MIYTWSVQSSRKLLNLSMSIESNSKWINETRLARVSLLRLAVSKCWHWHSMKNDINTEWAIPIWFDSIRFDGYFIINKVNKIIMVVNRKWFLYICSSWIRGSRHGNPALWWLFGQWSCNSNFNRNVRIRSRCLLVLWVFSWTFFPMSIICVRLSFHGCFFCCCCAAPNFHLAGG